MNVWRVLRLLAVLWLLKRAFRLLRALILTAIVVALWPVTLTAAVAAFAAWLRGWPPARLYWAAAWSAPVTAVYLIAAALQARSWRAVALAPVRDWRQAFRLLLHADVARAVWLIAPVAVPVGLAAGGAVWAWRTWAVMAGTSGRSAFAPAVFDARQWRRQVRAARCPPPAPSRWSPAPGQCPWVR